MEKREIYAVDDDIAIRDLYASSLEYGGFMYKTFNDATELYEGLNNEVPDLILLDVMLEGESGLDILKKLKNNKDYKNIPVIMVSAKNDEISKVKGLNLGADDYIAKPFGVLELIARINANLRKVAPKDNNLNNYKDITIDDTTHKVRVNEEEISLTLKEYELLHYLMKQNNKVVSKNELYEKVWGCDGDAVESRTIDIHLNTLRKKLGNSEVKIDTIRGVGFLLK